MRDIRRYKESNEKHRRVIEWLPRHLCASRGDNDGYVYSSTAGEADADTVDFATEDSVNNLTKYLWNPSVIRKACS